MRLSSAPFMLTAWLIVAAAGAQTAATQPPATQPEASPSAIARPATAAPTPTSTSTSTSAPTPTSAAVRPAAAAPTGAGAAPSPARSPSGHPPARHARRAAQRNVTAGTAAGVNLGATDITGNKELPKVMVIVPWKDSLGATGVVKPTDSLLDQVLQPVDRGVFQRQIHYYGQLNAAPDHPAGSKVAPGGDSH